MSALLVVRGVDAAPNDKAAEKLITKAMDEDYFNTDMDGALDKLNSALKTCGKNKCSKATVARIHMGMAVVYGEGKKDKAKSKAAFVTALKTDPKADPITDYMTPDLNKIFDEAKAEVKKGGGDDDDDDDSGKGDDDDDSGKGDDDDDDSGKGDDDDDDDVEPAGDLEYSPPKEALIDTPLPLFIEVPDDLDAASVYVSYRPFGATKWLKVNLKKLKGGYGGIVPCKELNTTGDLKFYIIVKDKAGDPVATAGTRKAPLIVTIKNEIEEDQPSLPGEDPPKKCSSADCPPDFPGCSKGGGPSGEGKGWGSSCEANDECRDGLVCLNGVCEQGEGDDDDDDDDTSGGGDGWSGPYPQNLFFVGFQFDLLSIDSASNVCGVSNDPNDFKQDLDNYFCFYPNDEGEYLGKPQEDRFNEVVGGLGFAGGRILIGYERIIYAGLAAGIRLGFAFGGSPSVGDAQDRFDACKDSGSDSCREPLANDFMPFHAEGRIAYYFPGPEGIGPNMGKNAGNLVKPYAFVGGGLAQVNAGVTVELCDYVEEDGFTPVTENDSGCRDDNGTPARRVKDTEVYQVTGLNFVGFGLGSMFTFHDYISASLEFKAMFMIPTFGFVAAPVISVVPHF